MREPTEDSIVIDGQWLEIARAEAGDGPEGFLPLSSLLQFPFANDAAIPHPDTQTMLPVPFGSLKNYVETLAQRWGSATIPVRLLFHRKFSDVTTQEEAMRKEPGTHVSEQELSEGFKSGKFVPLNQDGKINLPPET